MYLVCLLTGLRVLDLGSGSGRDCYVCAALVGEQGSVIGVDMTEEQIQVKQNWPAAHLGAVLLSTWPEDLQSWYR